MFPYFLTFWEEMNKYATVVTVVTPIVIVIVVIVIVSAAWL